MFHLFQKFEIVCAASRIDLFFMVQRHIVAAFD